MTSLAGERADAFVPGRLEVVDAPGAELDRQLDPARLGELVGVQAQRQPVLGAGLEVPARLRGVERALLQEDVRRLGDPDRLGEHLGEREVEVRVRVESNSGGTACAPSHVGTPPAARDRAELASSVSRSSP